jgi:hypothetical protein
MPDPSAILHQIGYHRDDTCFVSLNLTPAQFDTLQVALHVRTGSESLEEALTAMLEDWISHRSEDNGNSHSRREGCMARTA